MKILDLYRNLKTNLGVKNKFCPPKCHVLDSAECGATVLPRVTIPIFNKRNVYKNECVKALTCDTPFEQVFIVDSQTDTLLAKLDGDVGTCRIPKKLLCGQKVAILHGHPKLANGLTSPISLQDFIILNSDGVSEIVAYNSKGGQSILRKTNKFNVLSENELKEVKSRFANHLYKYADNDTKAKLNDLIEYIHKNKDSDLVKQAIAEILTKLQNKKCGVIAIDDFWQINAAKYGLEYIPFNN